MVNDEMTKEVSVVAVLYNIERNLQRNRFNAQNC